MRKREQQYAMWRGHKRTVQANCRDPKAKGQSFWAKRVDSVALHSRTATSSTSAEQLFGRVHPRPPAIAVLKVSFSGEHLVSRMETSAASSPKRGALPASPRHSRDRKSTR